MRDFNLYTIRGTFVLLLLWLSAPVMAAPVNDSFDHFTTGFPLTGGHRTVECDACHTTGTFAGTARECATCHSALMNTGAVVKSGFHIQSSNQCDACHTTLAWDDVRRVNHMSVLGQCRSCHLSDVPGIHVTIQPGDDCITCHRTSTWIAMHYDHSSAGTTCTNCHNGTNATGLPSGHMSTSGQQCSGCHTTHSWAFVHPSSYDFMRGHKSASCSACHPGGYTTAGTYTDDAANPGTCGGCHGPEWRSGHGGSMAGKQNCRNCHGFGDWD